MPEDNHHHPQPAPEAEPSLSFDEFTPPTYQEWREVAEASLKGAPFEKKVITRTYEDIELQPIYWRSDLEGLTQLATLPGEPPYLRGVETAGSVGRPWQVCQELRAPSPQELNEIARYDLARGQTALGLLLDEPTLRCLDDDDAESDEVGERGLSLCCLSDLETALADISLADTPLHALAGATALPLVAQLAALTRRRGGSPQDLRGCAGADPLGELARTGSISIPLEDAYGDMATLASWTRSEAPELRTVLVRGCPYHNAGASATGELAFALATGVDYLRALVDRGLHIDEAAPSFRFTFSLGTNFFMEIAKLRAARPLWSRIVEAFGGGDEARKMSIHGRTSAWTQTALDPYVNMLRNTTEAFAGIVGGLDSLHVRPFDEPIRRPDEFSRRVSRNVQLLLRLETHLTHPIDPAGGSYYVETLTDQVAERAWTQFQEIERRGGMRRALDEGFPQRETAAVATRRADALAFRKDVIVGTNLYPNPAEEPLEPRPIDREALLAARREVSAKAPPSPAPRKGEPSKETALSKLRETKGPDRVEAAINAAAAGATLSELFAARAGSEDATPRVYPLRVTRAAVPYERLRQRMARHAERTGRRISVFPANIGPIPRHKARYDFSRGFFEVGGFEVLRNEGFATAAEAATAAVESGAEVVVICSDDATYPEVVPELTRRIKEARPETTVILAGKPAPEHRAAYDEAGLDRFIFIKSNCLDVLESLQKEKGVRHE